MILFHFYETTFSWFSSYPTGCSFQSPLLVPPLHPASEQWSAQSSDFEPLSVLSIYTHSFGYLILSHGTKYHLCGDDSQILPQVWHLPSTTGSRQLPTWMSLGFSHLTFSTLIPWKSSLHPPTIVYNWSLPLGRPKPLVSSLTFLFLSLLKSNPAGNPFSSSFKIL